MTFLHPNSILTYMKKLDFVFVGPYRTGTTWLYEYFRRHPEVSVPTKVKETFFFDMKYNKGFKWYSSHFKENKKHKIRGEIAPSYFRSTEAAKKLLKINPDIKVFFTLRNPLDRIISHYRHAIIRGNIPPEIPINKAYEEYESFRYASQYSKFIKNWKNIIPEEQIHILNFERFKSNNQLYVNNICDILEITRFEIPEKLNHKVGQSIPVKYSFFTKFIYKILEVLRKMELYFIVNFIKSIKAKQLLFSKKNTFKIYKIEKKELKEKLRDQINFFKKISK